MSRRLTPLPGDMLELASRQGGYIATRQGPELGLHRNRLADWARAGALTLAVRGVYDVPGAVPTPASRSDQLDLRRRRASLIGLLAYGPSAVGTGLCALVLAGAQGAPVDLAPEVTFRHGDARRPIPEIRVRRVPVHRWICVGGFNLVEPEVALAQAVPEVDRLTAVSLMDSALNLKLVSVQGLRRAHELTRGRPGAARTHGWWGQADSRADSPAETIARLRCCDAGFPADAVQLEVRNHVGRLLARVELAWLLPDGRWLLAEIDGVDVHGTPHNVIADLHRQNPLVTSATVLRRYTGTQAMNGRLTTEVVAILRSTGWRPGATPKSAGPLVLTGAV